MKKTTQLTAEIVKSMGEYYRRDLITVPIVKRYSLSSLLQRSGLRVATLELDTAAHPNIEYVAGTRLSVYPINSEFNVQFVVDFLLDDLNTIFSGNDQIDPNYNSPFWVKFIQSNRHNGNALRLALTYLLDVSNFPSRELLRYIGECCAHTAQRHKMEAILSSQESWERYICQEQRTLRGVLEEFSSCKGRLSAKRVVIHELVPAQQPRQYSISNIKSSRRFRTEIIVFQHRFTPEQMALNLKTIQEHEKEEQQQTGVGRPARSPSSPLSPPARSVSPAAVKRRSPGPSRAQQQQQVARSRAVSSSVRSLRSVAVFSASPISNQQVRRLPVFAGPLMSLYAASSACNAPQTSAAPTNAQKVAPAGRTLKTVGTVSSANSNRSGAGIQPSHSLLSLSNMISSINSEGAISQADVAGQTNSKNTYEGLCSNYLLNLQAGDQIVCEFVENPRFTLKGNRERPIMMIAQDVGLVAFRPFWQQRNLEHDRAQVFYTMFKDLAPKKFGDMQLVCLTGGKHKIDELFRREINAALANKILSSAIDINRQQLIALLDSAAKRGAQSMAAPARASQMTINSKELLELGNRIYKLLVESNGCLYTCCDPHVTQAIEILTVECVTRFNKSNWTHEQVMSMLPKWKGRKEYREDLPTAMFQLENTFERAQIVQEIYDLSI